MATAATLAAVYLGVLLDDDRYFFRGDTQAAYYGWWYHLGDEVRSGRWPMLDPHAWRAGNIIAEGQWGLFSPLSIGIGILATLSPWVVGFATAVKLGLVGSGALGVFAVARSYGAPPPAAYVAGVAAPMGGMTAYLDLPSWAAGLMIWALFPWVWWALRRTLWQGANPFPALVLGYLLITVGYVYGTIMLVVLLGACLVDCWVARDRAAALRVLGVGVVCGLVTVLVYLAPILTAPVTMRAGAYGPSYGKFASDPAAMLTSILPSGVRPGTSGHLLPYAYLAWFLPVLLWLDLDRLRARWRPFAGLVALVVVTLLMVNGPDNLGPLRWFLRLQPFLVSEVVLLTVLLAVRCGISRPSPRRLALSGLWVLAATVVAVVRAPSLWPSHLVSAVVVCAALGATWVVARRPWSLPATAALVGALTVVTFAVQHAMFPDVPSPERNLPAARAAYQRPLSAAVGDVMVVGDPAAVGTEHPEATADLLVGSMWYLTGHRVQNTYTAVGNRAYYNRYCMAYQGSTCPEALPRVLSREPTTGVARLDLLGVSTVLLVRADFPRATWTAPPPGWRVADVTRWAVTWVRERPAPGAGRPVWSSPGTTVQPLSAGDRTLRFQVSQVAADGGRVVIGAIAWPGYTTDVGTLADPVDGYLLTVDLPQTSAGRTVTVHYSPPWWPLSLGSGALGVLGGLIWSAAVLVRRAVRRRRLRRCA